MHHQNARTPSGKHPCHHLGEITECATDQSGPGTCRIGKRPKQIEYGGHADLTARWPRIPVRGVEYRSETEPDTHLGDGPRHLLGPEVDADS